MEAYMTSAAKVTSDEKRIKEIGMDKVAARYWKIENNEELKKKGIDPLDEATRQILAENDELLQVFNVIIHGNIHGCVNKTYTYTSIDIYNYV
jgi:hypothetical protein